MLEKGEWTRMTTLENAPRRRKKEEENKGAIFYQEPTKFPYLREAIATACHPKYKPIKDGRLVGKRIKFKDGRVYHIVFWYYRDYDLGQPNEKSKNGYYFWEEGIKNENPTIIPHEGVIFDE